MRRHNRTQKGGNHNKDSKKGKPEFAANVMVMFGMREMVDTTLKFEPDNTNSVAVTYNAASLHFVS